MEQTATIRTQLTAQTARGFEIVFIHADQEAKGWTFPASVLQESIGLWENCQVMIDHEYFQRSVRDLGGVIQNVKWSQEQNGLTAELVPGGPSKEIIFEVARFLMAGGPTPDVGFSVDVIFTADAGGTVQKIMQPISCDLVMSPAFATRFIRQLNTRSTMPPTKPTPEQEAEAAHAIFEAQEKVNIEADAARATRIAMANQLLDSTLAVSGLPEPAQADVRGRFQDQPYRPADLTTAIKAWKDSLAAATAGDEIVGPHRVSAMFNDTDHARAAIDDLIGAPREKGAEGLKVAQFQGIRDAYLHFTGDYDFHGGYHRDRVQFQLTAANFPALVVSALNKALVVAWKQLGAAGYDWWEKITTIEHFTTLQQISWMIFGTVGSLPSIAEGADYTELKIGDKRETSDWTKYGGYVGLTLEAILRDDTRALRAIPRELALAGIRNISEQIAALFTVNAGAGPTLADTGALFNSTVVTTAGGHANLLTTALGTNYTAWEAAAAAVYNQPMLIANEAGYYGTGKKQAVDPSIILVPRALKGAAEALFMPRWASSVEAIAAVGGPTYGGQVVPVTVPEWTDATDWAAVVDPKIIPGIMLGEIFGVTPQIFVAGSETDPAMFANDESRIKVRHFLAVGVADFRPLHKSNVA
jgi:hypothetical protein